MKPAADLILWLAFYVLTLCFGYLFLEVWYPQAKHGAAVIALASSVLSFYFGAMYEKGKSMAALPPPKEERPEPQG